MKRYLLSALLMMGANVMCGEVKVDELDQQSLTVDKNNNKTVTAIMPLTQNQYRVNLGYKATYCQIKQYGIRTLESNGYVRKISINWVPDEAGSIKIYGNDTPYLKWDESTAGTLLGTFTKGETSVFTADNNQIFPYVSFKSAISSTSNYFRSITIEWETSAITFNEAAQGFGTYFADHAFIMPEGVCGTTIKEGDINDGEASLRWDYPSGSIVPANTALLMYSTTSGEVKYQKAETTAVAPADNMLKGTVYKAKTTGKAGDTFFMLSGGDNGIGFYWGEDDGKAFDNGGNRAYLALPSSVSLQSIHLDAPTLTKLSSAGYTKQRAEGEYTITGTKINDNMASQRGIVICDGKKILK